MVTTGGFSAFSSSGNVRRLLSTLSFLPVGVAVNELIGSFMFVDGRSMQPTLNPAYSGSYTSSRDLVFVAKWPIKVWRRYRKGEVVVLRSPVDPDVEVIRRLTGREREWRTRRVGMRQEPILEGFCWVTGDNPLYSEDSETYGPVPLALIEGWVAYVVWPLNRVGPVPKRVIQAPHAQRMPPQDL